MVTFNFESKEYRLEFDRRTALLTEKSGFNLAEIGSKPHSNVPLLVWGAFQKNHKKVSSDEAMRIFGALGSKTELINRLIDEYSATYADIFGEEGKDENLTDWQAR